MIWGCQSIDCCIGSAHHSLFENNFCKALCRSSLIEISVIPRYKKDHWVIHVKQLGLFLVGYICSSHRGYLLKMFVVIFFSWTNYWTLLKHIFVIYDTKYIHHRDICWKFGLRFSVVKLGGGLRGTNLHWGNTCYFFWVLVIE